MGLRITIVGVTHERNQRGLSMSFWKDGDRRMGLFVDVRRMVVDLVVARRVWLVLLRLVRG